LELSLDTAGDMASAALSREGSLVAELTWQCRANHSSELLPAVERLLAVAAASKSHLRTVFVCRGPGSYGGLRAGLSLGMALAFGLGVDVLGVGRLEVEAYQQRAYPGPVCAVHRAGRGELAWAAYRQCGDDLLELAAPQLSGPDDLAEQVPAGALFCGEIEPLLSAALRAREPEAPIVTGDAAIRRAGSLAELGWRRYAAGARTQGAFVEPIYLREPNITQAKPRL
jgi:tRNA threonylcarbamoyladenosine biosynthesis protein TsaB